MYLLSFHVILKEIIRVSIFIMIVSCHFRYNDPLEMSIQMLR
jgi:hypothetical protein